MNLINSHIVVEAQMKNLFRSSWCLLIPVAFYLGGILLCPVEDVQPLIKQGYAEQEEYTWVDRDGDEHDDQTLISINGVGKVLTYRDVYGSIVLLFIPFLVIGRFLYGERQEEFKAIIFGACVIGLALIALSTKKHVMSTFLFWIGIISASVIINHLTIKRKVID